jgi:hypothetical protein
VDTQCKFRFFRTSQGYFFQILSFLKHNLANAFNWRVRNLGLRFLKLAGDCVNSILNVAQLREERRRTMRSILGDCSAEITAFELKFS